MLLLKLSAHIRTLLVAFFSFPVAESDDEEIAEAVSETMAAIEGSRARRATKRMRGSITSESGLCRRG